MGNRVARAFLVSALSLAALAACQREQPVEVFLPPEGDAARGQQVFVEYDCHSCHTIPGVDLPQGVQIGDAVLALGVRLHRVSNYGDLFTAVIYPDHVVSPKYLGARRAAGEDEPVEMPDFTEKMTVAELIDLVEFLDDQYARLLDRQYTSKNAAPQGRLDRPRTN